MLPPEFLGKSPCLWKAQPPHQAKPQNWLFRIHPGHAPPASPCGAATAARAARAPDPPAGHNFLCLHPRLGRAINLRRSAQPESLQGLKSELQDKSLFLRKGSHSPRQRSGPKPPGGAGGRRPATESAHSRTPAPKKPRGCPSPAATRLLGVWEDKRGAGPSAGTQRSEPHEEAPHPAQNGGFPAPAPLLGNSPRRAGGLPSRLPVSPPPSWAR